MPAFTQEQNWSDGPTDTIFFCCRFIRRYSKAWVSSVITVGGRVILTLIHLFEPPPPAPVRRRLHRLLQFLRVRVRLALSPTLCPRHRLPAPLLLTICARAATDPG
jgi:hypothetical protein